MTLEEYKNKKNKNLITNNKYTSSLVKRTLFTALIVTIILLVTTFSDTFKNYIKKYLLETNFEFSKVNAIYQKYFGENEKTEVVSSNNLISYKEASDYLDGVKLMVGESYPVNLLESGIVVFIGEKEGYGFTIIVQQSNGIDAWYSGVTNPNVTIYSYIEKGSIIGSANKELIMAFQKDGEFLDYKDYIK